MREKKGEVKLPIRWDDKHLNPQPANQLVVQRTPADEIVITFGYAHAFVYGSEENQKKQVDAILKEGDVLRFLSKKNDVWFPKLKPVPVMGTEKENHTSWERYYRVSDCSSSSRNNWYLGR